MYAENGVYIDVKKLYEGNKAKLKYSGVLYNSGAQEVCVHLGFGLLWENLTELNMKKTASGFEAEIPLIKADSLNFCFRDNANNWDNNSYQNYSYEIKKAPTVTSTTTPKRSGRSLKVSMIDNLDLTPSSDTYKTLDNSICTAEVSYSLVPVLNSEFSQYRRLPQSYLRNKKMRVLFYRVFAYVPRLLNGYNKRRAKTFFRK